MDSLPPRFIPDRQPISPSLRFAIFKRDGFTCQYCGATAPEAPLELDHIEPLAAGGWDTPDNLITACITCNRGKAATPLSSVKASIKAPRRALPSYHVPAFDEHGRPGRVLKPVETMTSQEVAYVTAKLCSKSADLDYEIAWLRECYKVIKAAEQQAT